MATRIDPKEGQTARKADPCPACKRLTYSYSAAHERWECSSCGSHDR